MMPTLSLLLVLLMGLASTSAQSTDPTTFFGASENAAYLEWLKAHGDSYSRTEFLPSPAGNSTGAALHWTIRDDQIFLAVAAKATGWVGFGVAESGGMFGADVVTYMANTDSLIDSHILDERLPLPDDCQSWTLLDSTNDGGFLIFEASRLLDTGDTQDRPIMQDGELSTPPSRIITAWSDSPVIQNHGPNNRASTTIRFHGNGENSDFDAAMTAEAEGFVEIRAQDYPIKPVDTEYAYICVSYADLVAQGLPEGQELHSIGFEPLIDPRGKKHVHHFILQASMEGDAAAGSNCTDIDFIDMAYLWAPGEGPLQLPANLGGPLGENGFKSFQLEIHYDNPFLDTNVFDSSGVRIYYTSQKRESEIGILSLGDPFVSLETSPVGDGLSKHQFDCPGSCSSFALSEPVTVIREFLHMHKTGAAMSNTHYRDGQVIRRAEVQFYDFNQQGGFSVQQEPYQILPGDSFQTTCQYKAANDTVFGLSSSEEMCIGFIYYHPRQQISLGNFELPFVCGYEIPIPGCAADWQQTNLVRADDLNRTFGTSGTVCNGETTTTSGALSHLHVWSLVGVALVTGALVIVV